MVNGILPAGYGETRVVLLPVDPYVVHVYWEVSERDAICLKDPAEEGSPRSQAVLRFHDVTSAPVGGLRAAEGFDVEIQVDVRNWYVRLLSPEKAYIVDLGRFHHIARSNPAGTPRARPCKEEARQVMRVVEHDGALRVDHPVEREKAPETVSVEEGSKEDPAPRPREEGHRAVMGLPLMSVSAAGAEQTPEARPVMRPSEAAKGGAHVRAGEVPERVTLQRTLPVLGKDRGQGPVLPRENPGLIDTGERRRMKPAGTVERLKRPGSPAGQDKARSKKSPGPQEFAAAVDLSSWCEHLFVSGLSSAYSGRAAEGDGQD
jgi:hypothetical protein